MIIVRITGGLGNQMFQYALGRALSLKLDCELVLDVSFYPKQTLRKYELDKFNIQARYATQKEINNAGADSGVVSRLIHKFGLASIFYPQYIKELESIKYVSAIDNCKQGSYLDGYWQNPSYFELNKEILRKDFTPTEYRSEVVIKWSEKICKSNSVSLHIRRGDYVENAHTNSTHGLCSLEYYKRAIEHIEKKISKPTYFVFSDDIKWCKENLGFIENSFFVDNTSSAIDDLVLMGGCQHNIIANSTFSWWGAWLGRDLIAIAPKNWFCLESRNNIEVYPKKWLTL